jgi:hypothetical protein
MFWWVLQGLPWYLVSSLSTTPTPVPWVPVQYESPLLRSLKTLHNYLQAFDDLLDVDTVMYLRPFLDVIESQDTRCGGSLGRVAHVSSFRGLRCCCF